MYRIRKFILIDFIKQTFPNYQLVGRINQIVTGVSVYLYHNPVVHKGNLDRLPDNSNLRACPDFSEQLGNIALVQVHTAMADLSADAVRPVRPVNENGADGKPESMAP